MTTLRELLQQYAVGAEAKAEEEGMERYSEVPVRTASLRPERTEDGEAGATARQILEQEGVTVVVVTDGAQAEEAVVDLVMKGAVLGLDTETAKLAPYEDNEKAGLDPHLSRIRLVQVCRGDTVYVFDVDALGGLGPLKPLWGLDLVAHNAVFELKHLMHAGVCPEQIDCTMLMANALWGNLHSLEELAKEVLGLTVSKELQKSDWNAQQLTEEQIAYAALDAVLAHRLHAVLLERLVSGERLGVYDRMRAAQASIAKLELNGIHLDAEGHKRLIQAWEVEKVQAEKELQEVLGPEVNPASPQQLSKWLQSNLDKETLRQWPRTDTGQLETGGKALSRFSHLPVVQPLRKFKEVSKLLSTFGHGYAEHVSPATGRIHASFRLGGTATGRLSCKGPNVQNPPRDARLRTLFCAPPGRRLLIADYSQIELRVAALVSKDPVMLEAYEKGEDLHRKTAAAVAGKPPEQVTKEERQAAKAINFGLLYGQGPEGLAQYAKQSFDVEMGLSEARRAKEAFFRTYRGLARWQQQTSRLSKLEMAAVTPGGRVRDFRLEGRYKYTEALNTPIQGGAAEVMLEALAALERRLEGIDAKLVNVVHDEVLVEVAEGDLALAMEAVEQAMIEGMLAVFPGASTKGLVAVKIAANWAEGK
jgi:DNA polymerase I